jgi:hypothetical protein
MKCRHAQWPIVTSKKPDIKLARTKAERPAPPQTTKTPQSILLRGTRAAINNNAASETASKMSESADAGR